MMCIFPYTIKSNEIGVSKIVFDFKIDIPNLRRFWLPPGKNEQFEIFLELKSILLIGIYFESENMPKHSVVPASQIWCGFFLCHV